MSSSGFEPSPYPYLPGYNMENTPYLTVLPVSADPYNWRIQQVGALRTLGYPVDLERIGTGTVREIVAAQHDGDIPPSYMKQMQEHRRWYLPRLTNMDFEPWAQHTMPFSRPNLPMADIDPTQEDALSVHPGTRLPGNVDRGNFTGVLQYIDMLRGRGKPPTTATPHNRFGGTIIGCYLTSVNRALAALQDEGTPDMQRHVLKLPNPQEVNAYKRFAREGHRPATSEAIGALVHDYYLLLEQYVPEFAAFKRV